LKNIQQTKYAREQIRSNNIKSLLYIVNLVSIFFDLQMRFILRLQKESRKATNANKITINKREAKNDAKEAKETKVKTKKTKTNIKASARVDAKAITIATTTTIITTNKKQSSKLCKRFACTHVSLVFEIASILLNCLLLFDNSRECANNT